MYFDDQAYSMGDIKFPWKTNCQIQQINSFNELFDDNKTFQKAILYSSDKNFSQNGLISSFNEADISDLDIKLASVFMKYKTSLYPKTKL